MIGSSFCALLTQVVTATANGTRWSTCTTAVADKKSTVVKLRGVGDLFDLVYQDHFSFWVLDCVCINTGKYKLLKFSRD